MIEKGIQKEIQKGIQKGKSETHVTFQNIGSFFEI